MCMPQLQEGDEIVHINGRIVKELPHHEVLSRFEFIFSFTAPSSKHAFSLPVPIHYLLLVQRIWLYIMLGHVSNISNTRDRVSSDFQAPRRELQKYDAERRILDQIRGVWKFDETLSRVQSKQKLRR